MRSFFPIAVVIALFCAVVGLPRDASSASEAAAAPKALPPEYRALAKILARPMDLASVSKAATQPTPNLTDAMAQAHASIIDLRQIHSSDDGINQVASMAIDATEDLTKRIEDLDFALLSKPKHGASPAAKSSILEALPLLSPHHLLLHALGSMLSFEQEQNAESKSWKAGVQTDLAHIVEDSHQLDAAAMLLPKIAAPYSAPVSPNDSRVTLHFAEAWGPLSDDVLELVNSGSDLEDCTIAVELTGANGESRTNVHFVPKWESKGILVARYSPGQTVLDQTLDKTTISGARSVTVSIQSPSYSTRVMYAFNSKDHDKTISSICKNLKLIGAYSKKDHILSGPTYEATITLDGLASIPAGQIDLTLHSGTQTKLFSYPFKGWKKGETKLFPKLPFNPNSTDIVVTFPDTTYRYETKIGD